MSPRPPRVLWLVKSLAHGGTARLLALTAGELDRSRFTVEVAYVLEGMDAMAAPLRSQGVAVRCLGGRGRTGGVGWVERLRTLLHDGGFDLCHTHSPLPAAVARVVAPRDLPFVHTEHSVWPRYRLATRLVNDATYGRNDAVVAVSHAVAASIRHPARVRLPVEVVHHGIDSGTASRGPRARAEARRLLGLDAQAPVIGCVARLAREKDHDTLLRAFGLLAGTDPAVRLVLVGAGPLEDRLKGAVAAAGLGHRVLFTGARDDVTEILPAFDVVALTSRHEGLGLAVMEALAAGVPCVVTAAGGLPEVVQDGRSGLVVAPGDVAAVAAALTALLHDGERRAGMAWAAVARAEQFPLSSAPESLQRLYDRVLATEPLVRA